MTWPTPMNLVGGTPMPTFAIVGTDGVPTGAQGEPAASRRLVTLPPGSIPLIGDSIIQATHENLIHPAAVNFALGGQSLRRMCNSMPGMTFLQSSGAGVIACGVNDLSNIAAYGPRSNGDAVATVLFMFSKLAAYLTGKWVICHLLPCNEVWNTAYGYNSQTVAVNAGLAAAFAGTAAQIEFVPVNPALLDSNLALKLEYAFLYGANGVDKDGQHLNRDGTAIWAPDINAALQRLGL